MEHYTHCTLCPRQCGVNRAAGERGFCGAPGHLVAARASLHPWEEPCLVGQKGSGTVFFSYCTLRCGFCQNHHISTGDAGKEISVQRLSQIFLELQQQGAQNINLVTPTHYVPHIIEALTLTKSQGLSLPILYNTSGYERVETLRQLDGLIDIYLPDFKYYSHILSMKYSKAKNYREIATAALEEMVRQVGQAQLDDQGQMTRGVIVRHLVLPGQVEDSKRVLRHLFAHFGNTIYYSIMNQYTPLPQVPFPELARRVTEEEYDQVVEEATELGILHGFLQEGEAASESFIPEFDERGL